MGERFLRHVEKWLLPWWSREEAERAAIHSEAIRQRSIAARIEAERISTLYRDRLVGRRS
jgi:hypothetical protein